MLLLRKKNFKNIWLLGCSLIPVQPFGSPVQGPPLVKAAWSGDTDRVAALLRAGADANAADPTSGATALYWAVYRGNATTVRVLLATGADPKIRTFENSTPLELAACRGQTDIALALLDHGAPVDVQSDKYGSSPPDAGQHTRQYRYRGSYSSETSQSGTQES